MPEPGAHSVMETLASSMCAVPQTSCMTNVRNTCRIAMATDCAVTRNLISHHILSSAGAAMHCHALPCHVNDDTLHGSAWCLVCEVCRLGRLG